MGGSPVMGGSLASGIILKMDRSSTISRIPMLGGNQAMGGSPLSIGGREVVGEESDGMRSLHSLLAWSSLFLITWPPSHEK
ncbi:hypothetical protein MA16_Dca023788 [Dendrobium catenatum]|uniref:Uncharacterized protein n=1 Tax=Dendrobium catenatum TaxID=906689 RepID=A0A2I0XF92_9ASPA|nr:hypothetical protein MA16_Dca023788 [Dendrobium catenatum]